MQQGVRRDLDRSINKEDATDDFVSVPGSREKAKQEMRRLSGRPDVGQARAQGARIKGNCCARLPSYAHISSPQSRQDPQTWARWAAEQGSRT